MTFLTRLAIVALATYAVVAALVMAVVPRVWRRFLPDGGPDRRANLILQIRLLPAAAGLCASLNAFVAFITYEPRGADEVTGRILLLLAGTAAVLLVSGAIRAAAGTVRTRRLVRHWFARARPVALDGLPCRAFVVDTAFPIVAVVGLFRPRLLVARVVLDACTPAERNAVVAHERAHIRHRDNLRRALAAAAPDALCWTAVAGDMETAWRDATEEAADEAAGRDETTRVALASALIRVARLAPAQTALLDLPASALYRGEPIERRVRRLLDPPAAAARRGGWAWRLAVPAGLLLIGLSSLALVQHLVEAAVTFLP